LLKNQIKIDTWCSDTTYTKYLIEYVRVEDPLDAIARSVETTIEWSSKDNILPRDYLRYGNPNRIVHLISVGKISPWMLYQSTSGVQFLDKINPEHAKIIMDYINPEQWALKFHREPENVRTVKEILTAGGY
jgi:ABC-type ATPase with predicted acetyltransferase domain